MNKKIIFWLDRIIMVLITAGIFFAPFKVHWVKYSLIAALVFLFFQKIIIWKSGIRPAFRKSPLSKPVMVFLSCVFIAIIFSGDFNASQKIFFNKTIFYVGIFFLIKEAIDSRAKVYVLASVFLVSAFAVGIDALAQYFTGFDLWGNYPKNDPGVGRYIALSGPFGRYNFFSGYLEIALPFIIFLCFVPREKVFRIIAFFVSLMLLFCWIYVFQRTTWLSVTVSIFTISLFFKRKISLLIFGAAVIIAALVFPVSAWQRVFMGGDSNRLMMWKVGKEVAVKHPVFGSGLGAYSRYNKETADLHVHNTYFEVFIDTGIVGLAGFLCLLAVFLRKIFFSLRAARGEKKVILAGLSASCLSTFIAGLFCTNMLVGIGQSALFWVLFSLASLVPDLDFNPAGNAVA